MRRDEDGASATGWRGRRPRLLPLARVVSIVAAFALVAAACGDSSTDETSATVASTAAPEATSPAPAELTDVTFSLDWVISGQHAAFYLALERGYYEEVGLNVSIERGQGSAAVIQVLEAGAADLGLTDVTAVAIARSEGAEVKTCAVLYQKAPYVIDSLKPGADASSLESLEGLEIATGAGSFTPKIVEGVMSAAGLDPSTVNWVNVDPATKNAVLIQGQIEAIETFITTEAGIEPALGEGVELTSLLLADHGLQLYSNGIVVAEAFLSDHPEVVRAFLEATLRGWQDAIADPEAAIEEILKTQPELDPAISLRGMEIVSGLAVTPDTQEFGIGYIDPDKMQASYDFLQQWSGVDLDPALDVGELDCAEFMPAEPYLP